MTLWKTEKAGLAKAVREAHVFHTHLLPRNGRGASCQEKSFYKALYRSGLHESQVWKLIEPGNLFCEYAGKTIVQILKHSQSARLWISDLIRLEEISAEVKRKALMCFFASATTDLKKMRSYCARFNLSNQKITCPCLTCGQMDMKSMTPTCFACTAQYFDCGFEVKWTGIGMHVEVLSTKNGIVEIPYLNMSADNLITDISFPFPKMGKENLLSISDRYDVLIENQVYRPPLTLPGRLCQSSKQVEAANAYFEVVESKAFIRTNPIQKGDKIEWFYDY